MENAWSGFVKIIVGIIVVAIIAVILSKKSSSVQVLQTGSNAFNSLLKMILSPIQSGTTVVNGIDLGSGPAWSTNPVVQGAANGIFNNGLSNIGSYLK